MKVKDYYTADEWDNLDEDDNVEDDEEDIEGIDTLYNEP